jgi:hypothetical protein
MAEVTSRLKIGIGAGYFHPDRLRPAFASKTLQYVVQATARAARTPTKSSNS